MAHKLVIVESPAKARTIGGYLGKGYVVESSIGHIRDLPQSAAETPAKIKDKPWGRLAVDVEHDFVPYYVVPRDKKAQISKLKTLLKDADGSTSPPMRTARARRSSAPARRTQAQGAGAPDGVPRDHQA
ncbi:MAG: toprim domain-containing protein [Nocardioidaceae bacterium]